MKWRVEVEMNWKWNGIEKRVAGDFESDRPQMESQCSCCSVGVMCSLWTKIFYCRAAVCGTEDRGCSVTIVSMIGDRRGESYRSRVEK